MGGLKLEIATEVRASRPRTYTKVTELARLRDDQLSARRNIKSDNQQKGGTLPENRKGDSGPSEENAKPLPSEVQRLPWDELQKQCEKGL